MTTTIPPIEHACEICEADEIARVAEVHIPDLYSRIGEHGVMPYLICIGADCMTKVEAWADRDGATVHDVYLYSPSQVAA